MPHRSEPRNAPFVSHHGNDKKKIEPDEDQYYHVTLFAHFLDKLRSTADGEALLDHVMICRMRQCPERSEPARYP